ncbi:hypothetical protein [Sandarakinorhabdus oryzae]|uniref:hypothetical protein n=1 Tax=Sandarakinorhabdus oryzae TaxID=2675220 RepID=UPI0012E2A8F8|nr:hypothetical protein [Sandarakinorhabdus oryzae]
MIERKIRAGMMLDFPLPTYNSYANDVDILQPVPTLYCHVWREGGFSTSRGVTAGQLYRQGHRNFVWLPYRPGFVTFNALERGDVLSGPFSGCRMLLLEVNGVRQVYHVGTVGKADTPETLRTKRAAHALIGNADVTYICGFSPFENFKPPPDGLPGESVIPRILGLITHNGDMFSILMRKQSGDGNMFRVVDVQAGQPISRADALAFFNV